MNKRQIIFKKMKPAEFDRNISLCENICHGKTAKEVMQIYGISDTRVGQIYAKMMRKCLWLERQKGIGYQEANVVFEGKDNGIGGLIKYPDFWLERFDNLKAAYQRSISNKGI